MPRNKPDKLGSVLTKKQLIRVEKMVSCKDGHKRKVEALREYYSTPVIARRLKRKGWCPDTLARATAINYDRQRDTQES